MKLSTTSTPNINLTKILFKRGQYRKLKCSSPFQTLGGRTPYGKQHLYDTSLVFEGETTFTTGMIGSTDLLGITSFSMIGFISTHPIQVPVFISILQPDGARQTCFERIDTGRKSIIKRFRMIYIFNTSFKH